MNVTGSVGSLLDAVERALDRGDVATSEVGEVMIDASAQARERARDKMKDLEAKLERQQDRVVEHQEEGPQWWEPLIGSKQHEHRTKALEADVDYTHAEMDSQGTALKEAQQEGREALELMGRAIESQSSTFDAMRSMQQVLSEDQETIIGLLG